MFIETLVVGALQENSYVLACEETHEAAIIDPGAEPERIYQVITTQGLTLKYVLNTHGHLDHTGGVATIVAQSGVPFLMHQADMFLLHHFQDDPLQIYLQAEQPPTPTRFIQDGEEIALGNLTIAVLHTPGHTPGSVCFQVDDVIFGGDTLLPNSIGRTDLPGGDYHQLLQSIHEKLLPLDDAVRVYCGHGPATTIGHERQYNPFLKPPE